jgi:hypothetical protein
MPPSICRCGERALISASVALLAVGGAALMRASPAEARGKSAPPLARPDTKVIKTLAGHRLGSLFEGLEANSLSSLQWVQARQRPRSACTARESTTGLTWVERVLRATTVYAAQGCTGSGWAEERYQCSSGGTCEGEWRWTSVPDPNDYDGGFEYPPTYCFDSSGENSCGFVYPWCNNGEPPE